jgi:hypothetical protein
MDANALQNPAVEPGPEEPGGYEPFSSSANIRGS